MLLRHFAKTQNTSDTSNTQPGIASPVGTSVGTLYTPGATINDPHLVQILGDLWEEVYTDTQPTDWYVDPDIRHTGLKPKSSFFPIKSKGPYIETFSQAVYQEFLSICNEKKTGSNNLTLVEQKALKEIEANVNIIIKLVDKGGSIVVQDKVDYLMEASQD